MQHCEVTPTVKELHLEIMTSQISSSSLELKQSRARKKCSRNFCENKHGIIFLIENETSQHGYISLPKDITMLARDAYYDSSATLRVALAC